MSVSGATATVTLASAVAYGETVTVGYTRPATGATLQDPTGNAIATFSAQAVTNDTPDTTDTTAPTPGTAFAGASTGAGWSVVVDFGEALDEGSKPAASAFSVSVADTAQSFASHAIVGRTLAIFFLGTTPTAGQTVTVSYTKPASNPLRDTNGNEVASFAKHAVTNTIGDTAAPTFSSAAVDGEVLTLTFNEDLDWNIVPAPGAFHVTVTPAGGTTGVRRNVADKGVHIVGSTVELTLASAVANGDTIKVRYTKPTGDGASPLEDRAGNEVATFADQTVTNRTGGDKTAPTPGNAVAVVLNNNTWSVSIDFGEELNRAKPPKSAFSVSVGGTARPSPSVSISGQTLILFYVANPPTAGQTVTVSYTKPASNPLRDTNGNEVASFAKHAVTNTIGDTAAPTFSSAAVDGEVLTLTFNELLNWAAVPAPGAFHVTVTPAGGTTGARRNVADGGVDVVGSTVELTLASAVAGGETVKVRYTEPTGDGGSPLQDPAGNEVATFADQAVTNNTGGGPADTTAPTPGNAVAVSSTGMDWSVVIDFGEALDRVSIPAVSAFSVSVAGTARAVPSVAINGRSLVLIYAANPPTAGQTVTVSYTKPASKPLRDAAGNEVASFTNHAVTNAIGDTAAPTFSSAAVDGAVLTLTFNELLNWASVPLPGVFHVTVTPAGGATGERRNVADGGVHVVDSTVELTLASAVASGDTVKVRYTKPAGTGSTRLRDPAANDVATFADQAVTNNTGGGPADTTAPTPGNAFAAALTGGWRVGVDFGEALDEDSRPSVSAFSVLVADTAQTSTGNVSISGRTVGVVFLGTAPTAGQTVTVSYTKPASNPLRDAAGNEVASFTNHAVTNAFGDTAAPTFSSAAVDGTVLTATFNELLDWTVVPAPGAFHVTVTPAGGATGARRNVADGGVDIVGSTVELTLASAVANGDTVKVRYTKPTGDGASPLEDPAGNEVATFADQTVTNNTAGGASGTAGPGFRSASVSGDKLKMTFDEPLDEGSTPPGGSFRVTTTPEGGANGNGPRRRRSAQGPGGIGGTGTASVDGAEVTVTLDRAVAPGARLTVSYVPPGENALRDPAGKAAAPFSRQPATNVAPAPAVTAVAVVSDPGDDDTYGLGETIRVRLTFGEAVTVDTAGGTPRMKIRMNLTWGEKWAAYEGGSGTNALTFAYTVRPVNATPHGVAVLANTLELDGGAIASAARGTAANLAHAGLGHDPEHKVDYRLSPPAADAAPAVTGVAVVSDPGDDDTYGAGEAIRVRLTFGEAVTVDTAGGTPRMKIRMNLTWGEKWAAYEGGSGTNALTFAYTVRPVNATPHGVAVLANTLQLNGGTLASAATGTAANLAHAGLGHDPKHKVDYRLSAADTTAPVPESATVNGRDVTVTFDEALVAVGAWLHYDFTVTGGGVEQHPGRATVSGKTVTMRLGSGSPARGRAELHHRLFRRRVAQGRRGQRRGPLQRAGGGEPDAAGADGVGRPRRRGRGR